MNDPGKEDRLTLELLEAIEQDKSVTQRNLARRLGVALGLTNSYLKRCARKGLIKVQRIPPNRYTYYLTPAGFAEKARLAVTYFHTSLQLYRQAGHEYTELYEDCRRQGWHRVLLAGVSDLAEIAIVRSMGTAVEIVGIFDPFFTKPRFLGYRVFPALDDVAGEHDAVCLTSIDHAYEVYERMAGSWAGDRILMPAMLSRAVEDARMGSEVTKVSS